MTTFAIMTTRIGSELLRTGSTWTSAIKNAINDAIKLAAHEEFYFNKVRGLTFDTVIGQEYYGSTADSEIPLLGRIDTMYYTENGTRYDLHPIPNERMDELKLGNTTTGRPDVYSRYGLELRLDPTPSAVVTVTINGTSRLLPAPLSDDADTNAWMTYGEDYIRALAKSIFLRDIARDKKNADYFEEVAATKRIALALETGARESTGRLKPTKF